MLARLSAEIRGNELIQSGAKRIRDTPQDEHRGVALATFRLAEVGDREPGGRREILQCQVAGRAPLTYLGAELSQSLAIDRAECLGHPANLAPRAP